MRTEVSIELPLPLDIAGTLMKLIGTAYPKTSISTTDYNKMVLIIDDSDRRLDEDDSDLDVGADKVTDTDMVALLTSIRDGSFGISMPEYFSTFMVGALGDILESTNAENYLQMEVVNKDGQRYSVAACRSFGQSPHALRKDAEAKAELYAEKLRELGVDPSTL